MRILLILSAALTACGTALAVPAPGHQFASWKMDEGEITDMAPPNPHLKASLKGGEYTQTLNFRLPGIYYLWIRATSKSDLPQRFTYELDGVQPLRADKAVIEVPPHARSLWQSFTRHKRFKAQVFVGVPGKQTVTVKQMGKEEGAAKSRVSIEAVAVTLANLAVPRKGQLDESRDQSAMKWSPYRRGPSEKAPSVDGWGGEDPVPSAPAGGSAPNGRDLDRHLVGGPVFYVDAESGSDKSDGISPQSAWKSLTPVNARSFKPGDTVLFACGGRWEGSLVPAGGGAPGKPVTFGAYGKGRRPVIDGGKQSGVLVSGHSHLAFQDLAITNDSGSGADGISVVSRGAVQPRNISISRCVVEDAGGSGISVGPGSKDDAAEGYDGVTLEQCLVRWCNGTGITVSGRKQDGCKNTVIRKCTVYGNGSSGIIIHSGENGLIENCVAFNNGWMSGGTVGIWCWNARNVAIRRCESYRTMYFDGAGFDIDWSCMGCVIEYCYAHDNDGEGYLLMGSGTAKYEGFPMESGYCVARYNVSEADGLRGGGAGFVVCETFIDSFVYNNTAIGWSRGRKGASAGTFYLAGWELTEEWQNGGNTSGGWPARTRFLNNLVIEKSGTGAALNADQGSVDGGNTLDYNLYQGSGMPPINWAGEKSGSLSLMRSKYSQEIHGKIADPKLPGTLTGVPGRLPMDRLRPGKKSPAALAGTPVKLGDEWRRARLKMLGTAVPRQEITLDIADAAEDFSGHSLPAAGPPSIGALEP